MAKTITITIEPTGELALETSGFSGSECLKETEGLEASLGSVKNRKMKAEAYTTGAQLKQTVGSK